MFRIVHFVLYRSYKYVKSKLGPGGPLSKPRNRVAMYFQDRGLFIHHTTFVSYVIHILLIISQYRYLVCISIYVFFLNIVYVLLNIWYTSHVPIWQICIIENGRHTATFFFRTPMWLVPKTLMIWIVYYIFYNQ